MKSVIVRSSGGTASVSSMHPLLSFVANKHPPLTLLSPCDITRLSGWRDDKLLLRSQLCAVLIPLPRSTFYIISRSPPSACSASLRETFHSSGETTNCFSGRNYVPSLSHCPHSTFYIISRSPSSACSVRNIPSVSHRVPCGPIPFCLLLESRATIRHSSNQ